jgi:hypothetical protein
MKKAIIITGCIVAFSAFAKAQSLNSFKLEPLDSSKTLSGTLPEFKPDTSFTYKLPKAVPYMQFTPLQPLLNTQPQPDNFTSRMPVAKLQSADRMPVLKLGDSETTHYTMLIKRIGNEATNNKPTP